MEYVRLEFAKFSERVHAHSRSAPKKTKSSDVNDPLNALLYMLKSGSGGITFVNIDHHEVKRLPHSKIDDALTRFLRGVAPSLQSNPSNFQAVLEGFCKHTPEDRWDTQSLEYVASRIRLSSSQLSDLMKLEGQPQDGAWVLSLRGRLLVAGVKLFPPSAWNFCCSGEKKVGLRHTAALNTAAWLGDNGVEGMVFVRSSSSNGSEPDVHVILPNGPEAPPIVLSIDSLLEL
jgi:hypothetical protein